MWKSYVVTKIEVGPLWVLQALAMCFFCILTLDVSGPLGLSPCLSHLPIDSHREYRSWSWSRTGWARMKIRSPLAKVWDGQGKVLNQVQVFLKLGTCVAAWVSCPCWWLHLGLFQNATPRKWSGGLVILLLGVLGWLQRRRSLALLVACHGECYTK